MANPMMDIFKKKMDKLQTDNPTPDAAAANGAVVDSTPGDKAPKQSPDTSKTASELKSEAKDLSNSCKVAYNAFLAGVKADPQGALETLINSLEDLKTGPNDGGDSVESGDKAPLMMGMNG